jgi:hypothetical protein
MTSQNLNWSTIHASVVRNAGAMLRWTAATPRARDALRYRCPVTGSFVLVTDAASLDKLARPTARLRCADCGEMHLVRVEGGGDPGVIVAASDKP